MVDDNRINCGSFALLLVIVQDMLLVDVELPVEDVHCVLELQQRQLLPNLLHLEQNRLYYLQDLRAYRVDADLMRRNHTVLVAVQLPKQPRYPPRIHLLHHALRSLTYPRVPQVAVRILSNFPPHFIKIGPDIGPLAFPHSQIVDNRLEELLPSSQVDAFSEHSFVHSIHQLFIFCFQIQLLPVLKGAFAFHEFMGNFVEGGTESVFIFVPALPSAVLFQSGLEVLLVCCKFLSYEVECWLEGAIFQLIDELLAVAFGLLGCCLSADLYEVVFDGHIVLPPSLRDHPADLVDLRLEGQFVIFFHFLVLLCLFFNDVQIVLFEIGLVIQPFGDIFVNATDLLLRHAFLH